MNEQDAIRAEVFVKIDVAELAEMSPEQVHAVLDGVALCLCASKQVESECR